MNKRQELKLKYAAMLLSRADETKNLQSMAVAHEAIKDAVVDIYKGKIDVPTVLRVEQILNQGQANVLGKSSGAYQQMELLAGQAETGLLTYRLFTKRAKDYVEFAYATRLNVRKGRPFADGVPYDPVRSALTEFREELTQELTPRKGNPFLDGTETDKLRLYATTRAERDYLEKLLCHREAEEPEEKREHLDIFDKRMEKLIRRVEPPADEI